MGTRIDRHLGRWSFIGTLVARQMLGDESGFKAAFSAAEAAAVTVVGSPVSHYQMRFGGDIDYRLGHGWRFSLGFGGEKNIGQRPNAWAEAANRVGF